MRWTRFRSCMEPVRSLPRQQEGKQTCFPQGKHDKDGGECCKGAPERSGGAFISTLAAEGGEAPWRRIAQRLRPGAPRRTSASGATRRPSGRRDSRRADHRVGQRRLTDKGREARDKER